MAKKKNKQKKQKFNYEKMYKTMFNRLTKVIAEADAVASLTAGVAEKLKAIQAEAEELALDVAEE